MNKMNIITNKGGGGTPLNIIKISSFLFLNNIISRESLNDNITKHDLNVWHYLDPYCVLVSNNFSSYNYIKNELFDKTVYDGYTSKSASWVDNNWRNNFRPVIEIQK